MFDHQNNKVVIHENELQPMSEKHHSDAECAHGSEDCQRSRTSSSKKWTRIWLEHCNGVSLGGIANITEDQPSLLRRFFWVSVLLIGMCIFIYQVFDRTSYYFSRPVDISINLYRNTSIMFPSVIICNQNSFRLSSSASHGYYHWLDSRYANTRNQASLTSDLSHSGNNSNSRRYANMTLSDILLETEHKVTDMVTKCNWKGTDCRSDLKRIFTDHGVCYSFNADSDRVHYISRVGSKYGLQLQLNIEQYEYMRGPHFAGGVKVLLYDGRANALQKGPLGGSQGEISVIDLGDAIPAGSHSFLSVHLRQNKNLEPPYGKCKKTVVGKNAKKQMYLNSKCAIKCQVDYVIQHCGCKALYMPFSDDARLCTVIEYFECMLPSINDFRRKGITCDCPISCQETNYETKITYASKNSNNVSPGGNLKTLKANYIRARETEYKVKLSKITKDNEVIKDMDDEVQALIEIFELKNKALELISKELKYYEADIMSRSKFHKIKGLYKLKYAVDRDFRRGFMVLNERTFSHLTTNFYQMANFYRHMAAEMKHQSQLLTPEQMTALKITSYEINRIDLLKRKYQCIRTISNITKVHNGFVSGTSIIYFTKSLHKRYDAGYVPMKFLKPSQFELNYYTKLVARTNGILQVIGKLNKVNEDFMANGTILGYDEMDAIVKEFEKYCRSYNYYRFMYEEKIVNGAGRMVDKNIAAYNKVYDNMIDSFKDINILLETFSNDTSKNSIYDIKNVIEIAKSYMKNNSRVTRTDLHAIFTGKNTSLSLSQTMTYFSDMRNSGIRLRDLWNRAQVAYSELWRAMADEDALFKFYEIVNTDATQIARNQSTTQNKESFANMLKLKVEELSMFNESQLMQMSNGDFPSMHGGSKGFIDMMNRFQEVATNYDIVYLIAKKPARLKRSFDYFVDMLNDFKRGTVIDGKFYSDNFITMNIFMKQLTYEEIEQRKSYSLSSLFSDIGGSMGLFMGGSVISVIEIGDVFYRTIFKKEWRYGR